MYYKNPSYKVFYYLNVTLLILVSILCILPMLHIFAVSLSGKTAAESNLVTLFPIDFNLDSYVKTFQNDNFLHAIQISVWRSLIGTVMAMMVTVLAAFPLSRSNIEFKPRNFYVWFFLIIMIFDAGLIPHYLLIQKIGLVGSFWVYILPHLLNVWNIILMMNFFRAIPKELDEAATMDGATSFRIFFSVYLPISMPALATLSLFTLVGHWNNWFDGMLYMRSPEQWPLATLLQTIVVARDLSKTGIDFEDLELLSNRSVKAAQIFIAMIPILIVYPFLQRFFVKGMVIGAVKE
ncbi:L-arabinose transport system permease protein AraQ [Paenibacillus allorhizoplanae]|uniref:L-arabinose transport system permease protein AraQ n=1 Tax=Paenibacillus allorhizoplanae TaxID=2905648 RepID=A0ABM9CUP2_9BACL|nr:carbohydrate ABC transporter permease [Paenibacillus allorhizoplanae]CAH1223151.1 L-arabinose transport system permease protein AraQ [Paenibacillus allorhizoplanae]